MSKQLPPEATALTDALAARQEFPKLAHNVAASLVQAHAAAIAEYEGLLQLAKRQAGHWAIESVNLQERAAKLEAELKAATEKCQRLEEDLERMRKRLAAQEAPRHVEAAEAPRHMDEMVVAPLDPPFRRKPT